MNILMISKIDISKPTGETEHFLGLANGFAKLKHIVTILCPYPSSTKDLDFDKVNYIFIKSTHSKYKSLIFQVFLIFFLPILFIKNTIDFVYIRQGPFLFLPAILSKLFGYRIATEINGLLQEDMKILFNPPYFIIRFSKICEKLSYLSSDKIIAVTPQLKKLIKLKYNLNMNKIGVFSNGVDSDFYHITKRKHNSFNVLFMGGSSKWQGLNTFSEAIDIINTKKLSISFIIITDKYINKGKTKSFVNMNRKMIKDLLPDIDIALAPYSNLRNSISGISPIKIFTYLSAGIPVIVSNIGNIGSQIVFSNAGLSIEPDNPQLLAEKILYLFRNREQILHTMSKNARTLAKQYDWKIIASKILNFMYN